MNIVDYVTNTIQKPVVWTRVSIYQFGRHHGGCAVYTTSKRFMVLRFAETHSAVQVQQELRGKFGRAPPTPVTIRNNFKKYRDEGTSQNLCKQRSGRPKPARSLRNICAVRHALNRNPDMTARRNTLPNLSKSSFNRITKYELKWHPDGVGNIINNVYSLKHVKHDKDEFIRYNCSQQIDNVNNTHLLGCCLSWSRIVNTELGKSVA